MIQICYLLSPTFFISTIEVILVYIINRIIYSYLNDRKRSRCFQISINFHTPCAVECYVRVCIDRCRKREYRIGSASALYPYLGDFINQRRTIETALIAPARRLIKENQHRTR